MGDAQIRALERRYRETRSVEAGAVTFDQEAIYLSVRGEVTFVHLAPDGADLSSE
jgi:hypothetical protein